MLRFTAASAFFALTVSDATLTQTIHSQLHWGVLQVYCMLYAPHATTLKGVLVVQVNNPFVSLCVCGPFFSFGRCKAGEPQDTDKSYELKTSYACVF